MLRSDVILDADLITSIGVELVVMPLLSLWLVLVIRASELSDSPRCASKQASTSTESRSSNGRTALSAKDVDRKCRSLFAAREPCDECCAGTAALHPKTAPALPYRVAPWGE